MALPPPENEDVLLDAFAAHEQGALGLRPQTLRNHRIYLQAFLRWWRTERAPAPPAAATSADVAAFLIFEAGRGLNARTRGAELAALRGFFGWLLLTGATTSNPAAAVTRPRPEPLNSSTYRPAEVAAILAHTGGLPDVRGRQRHVIVATLRYTGMRSGELRLLRLRDLDLPGGQARVVGKGGLQRSVLLPPALLPTLSAFLEQVRPQLPDSPLLLANPHPFVTTPLSGFSSKVLATEVELAGVGAGIPGRHHPHKWRHTFATELVRAGVDIHVVQRLLGHTNIASTVGYTHLVLDDLRDAVAGLWSAA